MATIQSSLFSLPYLHTSLKPHKPTSILSHPNFFQPPKFPRLGIAYSKRKVISCLVEDDSKGFVEETSFGSIESSNSGATINLKHPRRSLLANFTCDACGVRSQRLINRLAYEKGTVYVQVVRHIINLLTISIL
uniref:uncharacterized protein LOC122597909 isoform X2 n=1 Tax=Erigeron canadensis TaxID=72917 RepID=UPI001CB89DFF|nr:uncharacterized protein LOC122597909 isoform X2 [Erigeron canadensis]